MLVAGHVVKEAPSMRYTFVGAGGIGGLIGTWLTRAGCDVTFVDRWSEHVKALARDGVHVTGSRGEHRVTLTAVTPDELASLAPLETVIVAVKSHDTRAALEQLLPYATDTTVFVSMQAGENLYTFEDVVGSHRTVGADPNFGGALVDPGHLEAGFPNYVWIGEMDGRVTPRLQSLQQDLLHWGPTYITDNIKGTVWTKFVYGSQIVLTAITDKPSGEALDAEVARIVAGEVVQEAISVADAIGLELVGFDFFDPAPYAGATPEDASGLHFWIEHAWPRHEVFRRHGFHRYVKTGSGLRWDLTYRKRKSEGTAMLRALIRAADDVGRPVPFNRALLAVIEQIENGERPLSDDNFDDLARMIQRQGGELHRALQTP
jgi:2-dehydropantoate 2-reductase